MEKILLVEDSPYYYERAKRIIKDSNYDVVIAENGQDGVDFYDSEKPDFVIMDICMPIMDGLTATKMITDVHKDAKIIICSSVGNVPIYRRQAIKNGAKGFLSKEFSKEELNFVLDEMRLYDKN